MTKHLDTLDEFLEAEERTYSTTPVRSAALEKRLVTLRADDPYARKKLSNLLQTLLEQSKFNRPDTLLRICETIRSLQEFIVHEELP